MFRRALLPLCCFAATGLIGAPAETGSNARQMLRARLAEQAKAPQAGSIPTAEPPKSETAKAIADAANAPKEEPARAKPSEAKTDVTKQAPTVMPQVEVKKGRITVLDVELAKQDKAIAREKEIAKSSDLDRKINDAPLAKTLSVFGGESSQFRQQVSQGRVRLMEDEKDLMEAIAQAKTREEKALLKKQLAELRAQRRELERAMR